jgi:predicted nucleic-acid-binding Zn-ribbon protein
MMRACSHCQQPFKPADLDRADSKGMERERKALGLQGVRFLYYTCSGCGYADIFVDIHPLDGETPEQFQERREALEQAVRGLHGDRVEVVITQK